MKQGILNYSISISSESGKLFLMAEWALTPYDEGGSPESRDVLFSCSRDFNYGSLKRKLAAIPGIQMTITSDLQITGAFDAGSILEGYLSER